MDNSSREDGHWWSRRWQWLLRDLGLIDQRQTAQSGYRVKRLDVMPGRVSALVQDRAGNGCDVEIRLLPWTATQWQRVVDALSEQALFAAQLLAGDLPPELDRALNAAGVTLLPANLDELTHACSCCDAAGASCPHLAVLYTALGELLADDPWLLFQLRGRDEQQVLRALRQQRSRSTATPSMQPMFPGSAQPGGIDSGFYRFASEQAAAAEVPDLASQIDMFWGSVKEQEQFRPQVATPTVELALLRRLGPPPFSGTSMETYEALTAVYRRITHEALNLAYSTESVTSSADQAEP